MEAASSVSDLGILDSVDDASITEIMESWDGFCRATEALLNGHGDLSVGSEFVSHAHSLCKRSLDSLVQDHFLRSLEVLLFYFCAFLGNMRTISVLLIK